MTAAFIYCRVSTQDQADGGSSLDTQEAACRAYCATKGYEVGAVFADTHTGAEWRERPALTRLREALTPGSVVVAHSLDRVSRNQTHLAVIVDLFEQAGARLELVTETFEDSAVGRFIRNAKAFAAEVELEKIRERVQRAMLRYMESGKRPPGGACPYGLRWIDDTKQGVEAEPATAEIVRGIFDWVANGATMRDVAKMLNDLGVPTPSGNAFWQSATIGYLLKNPIYKGEVFARRWRHGRVRGKWFSVERPASERIPLPDWPAEALVDAAVWDAAARVTARNRHMRRVTSAPDAFLLRGGFARCGACNRPLSIHGASRPIGHYRCQPPQRQPDLCPAPAYVRAQELDAAAWEGSPTWPGVVAVYRECVEWTRAQEVKAKPAKRDTALAERAHRRAVAEVAALRRALGQSTDADVTAMILADLNGAMERLRASENERPTAQAPQRQFSEVELRERAAQAAEATSFAERRKHLEFLGVTARVYRPATRRQTPTFEITSSVVQLLSVQ